MGLTVIAAECGEPEGVEPKPHKHAKNPFTGCPMAERTRRASCADGPRISKGPPTETRPGMKF